MNLIFTKYYLVNQKNKKFYLMPFNRYSRINEDEFKTLVKKQK